MNLAKNLAEKIKIEDQLSPEIGDQESRREESGSLTDQFVETEEGKWSAEENEAFILFMDYYKSIFCNKNRRKKSKVYTYFSDFIKTRTPRQCRSRYQKIMAYFNSFTKAKKHYINNLGAEEYEAKFSRFISKLESQPNYLKIKRPVYGRPKKQKQTDKVKVEELYEVPEVLPPSTSNISPKAE